MITLKNHFLHFFEIVSDCIFNFRDFLKIQFGGNSSFKLENKNVEKDFFTLS